MADLMQIILLVVTVLLIGIALYIGDKLVGDRRVEFTMDYYLRAILTAFIIIVLIIVAATVVGLIDILGIGQILPILAFVLSVYAIKMFLMRSSSYERATWVGVITWIFVYIFDYIGGLLGIDLIQFF